MARYLVEAHYIGTYHSMVLEEDIVVRTNSIFAVNAPSAKAAARKAVREWDSPNEVLTHVYTSPVKGASHFNPNDDEYTITL